MSSLSVIVPCYNEEVALPIFFERIEKIRLEFPLEFEYIFVNDGSTDGTLDTLRSLCDENTFVHYLSFSRNFGKEAAILAGLQTASGDYVTLMDADLQDPPELLLEMYEKIQEKDIDCVAAQRVSRSGEALLISVGSRLFYKLINKMSKTEIIDGVRDFRLMTRQVVDAILQLSEYNRFSKGLFSWVGFNTQYISYENQQRVAGKTKWNFWEKVAYAFDGFVNFSEAPLEIATYTGLTTVFLTIIGIIALIIRQLFFHHSVSGWTSMIVVLLFCFGFTLLMLGIIGKYISNIFLESKKRPVYIVKEQK
ncbi:glycosyltransferase family 2 protein [Lactococcus nasutitermitis]|uniref:Glycosyltransferase family 2 protein n=1 Tax=Lactococcus nasutitermitis TaxID=1652957 RepID=A0ABV9JC11_9LACT|nr:glycosyltransferase family 2 protein [Lactococcus nasutitermitis]